MQSTLFIKIKALLISNSKTESSIAIDSLAEGLSKIIADEISKNTKVVIMPSEGLKMTYASPTGVLPITITSPIEGFIEFVG